MGYWMGLSGPVVVVVVVIAAMVQCSAAQTTHVVGESTGWRVPSQSNSDFYATWARNKTFTVGDILSFNFNTGSHDVAVVNKTDFDSCNTNPAGKIYSSPTNITLNSTGMNYYICTIDSHCTGGQKLSINVNASTSSGTSPPPPPGGTTTSPPPPPPSNSSAPSRAAGFGVAGVSVIAVFTALFL